MYIYKSFGRSSNGRTRGSGPWNRGSNPCLPAQTPAGLGRLVDFWEYDDNMDYMDKVNKIKLCKLPTFFGTALAFISAG